jgi:dTDP-glucose pyrophosphorylase
MKPSLLILAAGIGSRYGSLKQIDKFGPSGEAIIEYSIYDAIRAGFRKVVFVIRENMGEDFKNFVKDKFQNKIEIYFAYQELNNVPEGILVPPERIKPWGTAHAVLVASDVINEPFTIINADDFYGQGAYKIIYDFLDSHDQSIDSSFCIMGYQLSKTLSDHGYVSRAICETDENENLMDIVERTHIYKTEKGIVYENEEGNPVTVEGNPSVSMNMMGFSPSIFDHLENSFKDFIEKHHNDIKAELYLPYVVNEIIKSDKAIVKVLRTDETWFGVTYKEDKPIVNQKIKALVEEGKYPKSLWT